MLAMRLPLLLLLLLLLLDRNSRCNLDRTETMLPETLKEIYCKLSDKIKNHLVYYYNAVLLLMKINAITLS